MARSELVVGLDIGTTKTCCVVAQVEEGREPEICGVGVSPSAGVKRGIVVDLDATVRSIEAAVAEASQQCGFEITSALVGVTGEHITTLNSSGVIAITHSDREITEDDVERVLEASRVIVVPPERMILHAIPRSYSIDGQNGIKHPVGMSGTRLEVETHIVTGANTFLQNVEKCVTRAGLAVEDMVLEPLATGEAVLMPAERELGVCLVDIGGGTSDVAIFREGEIYFSAVVPVGGRHVTNDLAQLLRMAVEDAEQLKVTQGCAVADGVGEDEAVNVRQIGAETARPFRRRALCQIIEARMQEVFQLVQKEILKSGCHDQLAAGVVLTGGGALLRGTTECAARVLELPVRIGRPGGVAGLSDKVAGPAFATSVGLVRYGARQRTARSSFGHRPMGTVRGFFLRLLERLRAD
ncbi:MAG: cell division protein FtsA [Chthonomonadales bacterium]